VKKKMWLLSGVAVFVIAVVVVLVAVLTSGPDTSTPEGAAEAAVDDQCDRGGEHLPEHATDARAGHVGHGSAAVDQTIGLHIVRSPNKSGEQAVRHHGANRL
jgi:hypothetical protein